MKNKISILITIYLLSNSALTAQNIEKLNKSELREQLVILTSKIDSLKNENLILEDSKNKLTINSSLLEQKNKTNEDAISRNNNEIDRLKSENVIAFSKLNETIVIFKDSISNIRSSSNVILTSTTHNSNDFLNKYYFDQIPLPNNSYNLVLSKLVYKGRENGSFENNESVSGIPEILDKNAFTYWGVNPNVILTGGSQFKNYIISKNIDYLNSKLPKIEILKNKLFTLKYNDGSEESFLFNVKKLDTNVNNNQRKILQIELANENVREDGSTNRESDIVWRFFAVENECYLALTSTQLNRLKFILHPIHDGLEVSSVSRPAPHFTTNFSDYDKNKTTGEGIYISRNKDLFMEGSNYIDPSELIYLFKLK
jgi:hypothetical protein